MIPKHIQVIAKKKAAQVQDIISPISSLDGSFLIGMGVTQ